MTENKRAAFRIQNPMQISYELASQNEIDSGNFLYDEPESDDFSYEQQISHFKHMIQQLEPQLALQNKALQNYFYVIEQRIELLETLFLVEHGNFSNPQALDISETGMAFGTSERYDNTTWFKISLLLPTNMKIINILSQVVNCRDATEDTNLATEYPFWTAVKFVHFEQQHQRQLTQFLLHQQVKN